MAAFSTRVSGLAGRYAGALLELAEEKKQLDAVAADLRGLQGLIRESEDLRRLLRSPLLGRDRQAQALEAILQKAGVSDTTRRFALVVAHNGRLFALAEMIEAYLEELARRRGEVTAQVTAAQELSDTQHRNLEQALRKTVGGKVNIDLRVDPALIGGLVVRVGSRMIDNSLSSKLHRLEHAMKGAG